MDQDTATDGSPRLAVIVRRLVPGAGWPLHRHGAGDEVVTVLEGDLVVVRGGIAHLLGPGGALVLPGGTVHGLAAGADGARIATVVWPAAFAVDHDRLTAADDPTALEALVALAAQHGCVLSGPIPTTTADIQLEPAG